jgi:hypothetical protein
VHVLIGCNRPFKFTAIRPTFLNNIAGVAKVQMQSLTRHDDARMIGNAKIILAIRSREYPACRDRLQAGG